MCKFESFIKMINFEATELRLGLPGGNGGSSEGGGGGGGGGEKAKNNNINGMKRGFADTVVDLKLNLSTKESGGVDVIEKTKGKSASATGATDLSKPPAK